MSAYFLWCEGQRRGPFALPQLEQMLDRAEITMQTLCATQGQDDWRPLQEFVRVAEPRVASPSGSNTSARPQWLRVSDRASDVVMLGLVLILIALVLLFAAVVAANTEGSHTRGILWTAASFFGAGSWFVLLGQIMHIRSAVERTAERE